MELKEFKDYIKGFKEDTVFEYSISHPFSWRGSYDEVAFEVLKESSTREDILQKIEYAFTKTFHGYKGGEFTFKDYTTVNFESDQRSWSDGHYCAEWISKIEEGKIILSEEERLIKLIFKE